MNHINAIKRAGKLLYWQPLTEANYAIYHKDKQRVVAEAFSMSPDEEVLDLSKKEMRCNGKIMILTDGDDCCGLGFFQCFPNLGALFIEGVCLPSDLQGKGLALKAVREFSAEFDIEFICGATQNPYMIEAVKSKGQTWIDPRTCDDAGILAVYRNVIDHCYPDKYLYEENCFFKGIYDRQLGPDVPVQDDQPHFEASWPGFSRKRGDAVFFVTRVAR